MLLKRPIKLRFFAALIVLAILVHSTPLAQATTECYRKMFDYLFAIKGGRDNSPVLIYADNTEIPISRAFEKEGLLYRDISQWFDTIDKKVFTDKLTARLKVEKGFQKKGTFTRWLDEYSEKYRAPGVKMPPKQWAALNEEQKLKFLFKNDNPFDVINVKGRESLFYDGHLSFDDLRKSEITPPYLTVGDDLGSYEVRSDGGVADLNQYGKQRLEVETVLGDGVEEAGVFVKEIDPKQMKSTESVRLPLKVSKNNEPASAAALNVDGLADVVKGKNKSLKIDGKRFTVDRFSESPLGDIEFRVLNNDDVYFAKITPSRNGKPAKTRLTKSMGNSEGYAYGQVGHQHKVHAWPEDAAKRKEMAGEYIELLDSTTWYLFWRQAGRSPVEVESIIHHPYLGVYTRSSLDRLYDAVIQGKPENFKNKYRMVGARNIPGQKGIPGQEGKRLADWELRSGNKGAKRDVVESLIEARISTGDYSGLKKYNSYDFDPSAPIKKLTKAHLDDDQIKLLEEFEQSFPYMQWSGSKNAHNHVRNKLIAPLLPWDKRFNIAYKEERFVNAQKNYAEDLVRISKEYLRKAKKAKPDELGELRVETMDALEKANYDFARIVRIEKDIEKYIVPRPSKLPSVVIENTGPDININQVDTGVEYTWRFPVTILSKEQAANRLGDLAERIKKAMGGGKIERLDEGGHGHGLSVRYKYTDPQDRAWRVEWDGVKRDYEGGKPKSPRKGHVEIPTPKDNPQDASEIKILYEAAREAGGTPWRGGGGAHVNMDIGPLRELPKNEGPRKVANLIALVDNEEPMISFLWQHPFRKGVAIKPPTIPGFTQQLDQFKGNWDELASMLYDNRYFNPYVGRKPAYTQMNATAIFKDKADDAFKKEIDIKNPTVQWYPSFAGKPGDKLEFRLFDAPSDEYMAALQLKYARALANKAFNSKKIKVQSAYAKDARELWKRDFSEFSKAASRHLRDLGLNPVEFKPLVVESYGVQQRVSKKIRPNIIFDGFKHPSDPIQ